MVSGPWVSYGLHPEPGHMNSPDAWMVYRTTLVLDGDEDEDAVTGTEMLSHGTSFDVALDQIRMDHER